MLHHHLNPDLTYNRSAIMRSAWATARRTLATATRYGDKTTLRAEFRDALSRAWDSVKASRAARLWAIEQDALRLRPTAPVTPVQAARSALMLAEMSDAHNGHELVAAARAQLASVHLAA